MVSKETPDSPTTISADHSQDEKIFGGRGQDLTEAFNAAHGDGTHLDTNRHVTDDADADVGDATDACNEADTNAHANTDADADAQEVVQKTLGTTVSPDESLLDTDDASEDSGTVGTNTFQLLNTEEPDKHGEFPSVSLGSIKEDKAFEPSDDLIEKLALEWLNDENSVSSFSTHETKSKAQLRLEKYERPALSKSDIDAKLEAASSRRDLAISSTLEKANTQVKMEQADLKIKSRQLKVKELSDKFNMKMEAASKRKATILESTVRDKAVDAKAKDMQAQNDTRVAAMQEKLERKLLAALERKENIISARSSRASTDVSVSSKRGKSAMKQKEMMMTRLRDKSERKLNGASSRRKQLRDLEKEKHEVMMLRREMAKTLSTEDKLESIQKKLEEKMELAHERKNRFLAAKKAKAAEHLFFTSDRGLEVLKEKETFDSEAKTKVSEKHDAAEGRRLAIAEKERKKMKKANMRRQRALELVRERKSERATISGWEEEFLSPQNGEYSDVNLGTAENDEDSTIGGDESSCANSYDEKRLKAKQQLVNEIRLANEAKYEEMERLTKQIRQPGRMTREKSVSAQSFGTIDTNDGMSYDEGDADFSISGLSTVREEENNNFDRKKAQAALALAELDIKLSEIQLMQAILLAEEASLSGKADFKTSDQSVEDLSRVKNSKDIHMMEKQKRSDYRKKIIKTRAKKIFCHTLQQAKVAQIIAGKTLGELKTKIEKTDMELRKRGARPISTPGGPR